jgi:hypothetical protein
MRTSLAKVQATLADDQAWLQERKAQLASAESSLQARISLS